MQTGSRVSCTARLQALREERGQPARAGRKRESERDTQTDKKRKSNLSTPSLIFIQTRVKLCLSCFHPSVSSLSLLSFPSPFAPSITYSFSLFFPLLIMAHLISSLTYNIYYSRGTGKGKKRSCPAPCKYLQLKDKSVLKESWEASGETQRISWSVM